VSFRSLSVERGQPYRRAKDFPAPSRRATDRRSIPPLLKLTMPASNIRTTVAEPMWRNASRTAPHPGIRSSV